MGRVITIDDRRLAYLRARDGHKRFWGLGCLQLCADAWPDALVGVGAGKVICTYRKWGLAAAMVLLFDLPRPKSDRASELPLPADPTVVRIDGQEVAGLATPQGVFIRTPEGLAPVKAPIVASWDIAAWMAIPCRQ